MFRELYKEYIWRLCRRGVLAGEGREGKEEVRIIIKERWMMILVLVLVLVLVLICCLVGVVRNKQVVTSNRFDRIISL